MGSRGFARVEKKGVVGGFKEGGRFWGGYFIHRISQPDKGSASLHLEQELCGFNLTQLRT
jgi:hypothetical protein